jgi:hypothetical protein
VLWFGFKADAFDGGTATVFLFIITLPTVFKISCLCKAEQIMV